VDHLVTLRVGVDLSPAFVGYTGIARYARTLWGLLSSDPAVRASAFAAGRGVATRDPHVRRIPVPLRVLQGAWRATSFPRAEMLIGAVDVVHSIDLLPAPTRKPLVMTWHDTFALSGPEYHHPHALRLRARRVEAARRAAVVLVTCESLANEVAEHVGLSRERIVVSPLGADLPRASEIPPPVEGPFVLAAGAISPRKGFGLLARALASLGSAAPPLVLAGPDGWNAEAVHRELRDALPPDRLILLGDRYEQMPALYRQATLVVHPSLAEGFGLVCLEAMASGAAVVAADIPSIREMGGGALSLVAPGEMEPLAAAVRWLLDDHESRRQLGEAARARAATYTWARTYERTKVGYERACGIA